MSQTVFDYPLATGGRPIPAWIIVDGAAMMAFVVLFIVIAIARTWPRRP